MTTAPYLYSAYTAQQDGTTFEIIGTEAEAMAAAKKYAHEAFPKGQIVTCAVQVADKSEDRVTETITA